MMEEFEYQRYWWLPDGPEKRVLGTLKFDPEGGATLNLLGSFNGLEGATVPLEPNLILGFLSNGRSITLHQQAAYDA
jgi:hypothetical protein